MTIIINFLLLAVGFVLLIKGGDFLVSGAASLAKRYNVSDIVVGLTIVAFGTSTPELFVNVFASLKGNSEIAVGNILGSNIFNILVILGVSAVIYPLTVTKNTVWKEIPFSLLAACLVGVMANDRIFDGLAVNAITRTDGITLLAFFVIFLIYVFEMSQSFDSITAGEEVRMENRLWKIFLLILAGLGFLFVGARFVVDAAVSLARMWGVSESLIGLTIVAAGTSLPELATSAVAAKKKNCDIAIGNIVGSNIFNIFMVLGVSAVIHPLPFQIPRDNADVLMTIAVSVLLFVLVFIGKKRVLDRAEGIVLLVLYAGYLAYLIHRG